VTSPKILIVDDDPDFALALSVVLEMQGYEVCLADSGEAALSEFSEGGIDITFMDFKLTGMTGVGAFNAMRRLDPQARIVIMTGYRIEELLAQAVDGGAVRILCGPFTKQEMLDATREIQPRGLALVVNERSGAAAEVSDVLDENGYRFVVAKSAQEALERDPGDGSDILVLDLGLPVVPALGMFLELKGRQGCPPTVIVADDIREGPEGSDVLKSLAVTGCLFKPFEPQQLLETIRRICAAGPG
jgi:DNA-binding response OmpR family regulator